MTSKRTFPSKADVLARTPDPAIRQMLEHLDQAGIETAFDRFDAQKPLCGFGLSGTCCKNCHMGPCRITPKAPRGVCGADAHLIVARNLLRWTAAGRHLRGNPLELRSDHPARSGDGDPPPAGTVHCLGAKDRLAL